MSTHAHAAEPHAAQDTKDLGGSTMLGAVVGLLVAVMVPLAGNAFTAPAGHHAATSQHATGRKGAVASAAPEASRIGLEVLERGGNAYDALVATSFAVSVLRPQSTGIGGGGFVLYRTADGMTGVFDGRETAPEKARRTMYLDAEGHADPRASTEGPRAAGVPGLVALLHEVHEKLGRKDAEGKPVIAWADLVRPAATLAREGFPIPAPLARAIADKAEVLRRYPSSAAVFLPHGMPLAEGELLVQNDLASTLDQIAEEPGEFYTGALARVIVIGSAGALSHMDLADYEVEARDVVEGTYRGWRVITMPPPSSGGVHLLQMLNILEGYHLGELEPEGSEYCHLLAESMRRAFADRAEHLGDPAFVHVPVAWLIDRAYAGQLRQGIDLQRATPSSQVRAGAAPAPGGDHTTHISIVDGDGNAVSSTQTINTALGSCYVVPGTGILLNDEMDDFAAQPGAANAFGLVQGEKNAIAPGKRPLSSMTPTVLLDPQGRLRLVLGSPGGPRIINSVLQVVLRVVDFHQPLEEAVGAPRVHHQWLPDRLEVESGYSAATLRELARLGHLVHVRPREEPIGNVQAVLVHPDGRREAASDPRGTGRPAAY